MARRGLLSGGAPTANDTLHGWRAWAGDFLAATLDACAAARDLVKSEQAKIQPLIDAATSDVEREAREYQRDLIGWQLTRAAELAEKRIAHFETLEDFDAENEKCAADTSHWFEFYAWTVDPRCPALAVVPLGLFEFQERYINWLEQITFEHQSCGVVEKSRTMGATETALRWMLKQWRYRPNFYGMPLSANEDLVDSKKDPGTLFEKLRFQLRLLPPWMLPKGFSLERDMPFMQLSNAENGSILQGDAPTANVGRQRRLTFILKDESAMWPNGGFQQHTSLSRSSNTIVDVSSVQGKFNKFAQIAHDNRTPKFVMDWREHPWLDKRWYDALPFGYLGPAMTEEEIAQEIDRDYEASQPGKVFKQWREEYVLITWKELVEYYDQFGLGHKFIEPHTGQYRVPDDCSWGRMQDYGQTTGHPWIVSHMFRPRENYPLHDSVFIFSMHRVSPTGASPAEGRNQYRQREEYFGLLKPDGEYLMEPEMSEMSHEQCGEGGLAETLLDEFGDYWSAWNTDYTVGIPQTQQWLDLIETNQPNPIRPALMGRTRIYCVADPSEYTFAFDKKNQRYFVTPSKTDAGFKLYREEMPAYHYPPEELGKPVKKMRPKKIKDDCIDTVRGFATRWGPSVIEMTKQERRIAKMPEHLKPAAVAAKLHTEDFTNAYWAQQHALGLIKKQEEKEELEEQKAWSKVMGRPAQHNRYRR